MGKTEVCYSIFHFRFWQKSVMVKATVIFEQPRLECCWYPNCSSTPKKCHICHTCRISQIKT